MAERGVASLVLDRQPEPFAGASIRNEGKLHLGFVYALDGSGRTTSEMVEGALTFTPLLERWCGDIDWEANRSDRFAYAVVEGGLATPAELERHYGDVVSAVEKAGSELGRSYLGEEIQPAFTRGDGPPPGLRDGFCSAWFDTPERSVDPRILRHHLTKAIEREPLVDLLTGRDVVSAGRTDSGFELKVASADGTETLATGRVANCAWERRAALDDQVGHPVEGLCYRLKHQVVIRGERSGHLTPLTIVQGPFGDVVPWPGGDVYVNWYPVTRTWFGDRPVEDPLPDPGVADATLRKMTEIVPALEGSEVVNHGPCHIVAAAQSDIEDVESGLHSRLSPGISGDAGWLSLSPGKLTTAPLASERCAALMTDTPPYV